MKNLNPLYENVFYSSTRKLFNDGTRKTFKNRKKIKKYLVDKYDNYVSNKESKDLENEE